MSTIQDLMQRSNSSCECCGAKDGLELFVVSPKEEETADNCVLVCETCSSQISDTDTADANHWRCLNECMWSEIQAVQVISWRMLNALKHEGWPQDLLDMLYLDEETLNWAKFGFSDASEGSELVHKDSNGVALQNGDSVVLIKDLNVKGANFTAKRGAAVRNINLVWDNPEHIEGKVNGQQIVILTKFVKKSN